MLAARPHPLLEHDDRGSRSAVPSSGRHDRTRATTPASGSAGGSGGGSDAVGFAVAARALGNAARTQRLVAPSFRCPPRVAGVERTLRRHPTGAVVSVQVRGRPWPAVVSDMIEGVIVTNRLTPPQADRLRTELWQAVGFERPLLRRVA